MWPDAITVTSECLPFSCPVLFFHKKAVKTIGFIFTGHNSISI